MSKQKITAINGVEIFAEVTDDGVIYVPVRPLCEAIGVDPEGQRQRIERHYILRSVAFTLKATGSDGKKYEMLCLPLEYVYGWLFTIDANLVAESARERVAEYQRECYDALYHHFTTSMQRTLAANKAEIELLRGINAAIDDEKSAKSRRKKLEAELQHLRDERLNPQPALF